MKLLLAGITVLACFASVAWCDGLEVVRQSVVELDGGRARVVKRTGRMMTSRKPRVASPPPVSDASSGRLLWHQHEETAIYDSAAISTAGYIAAATFLNPPEMVEIYRITGESVARKAGVVDMNHDGARYKVALSRDSTVCVGMATIQGNFTSLLFKW